MSELFAQEVPLGFGSMFMVLLEVVQRANLRAIVVSRLVLVLSVVKRPGIEINCGGNDVADEIIADAKEPLRIQWFSDSFIDFPVKW